MPRPVTRAVAHHDDPNDPQHARDAEEKKQRDKTVWEPRSAEPHNRIVVENFKYPTKGYCFQVNEAGYARVVDGPTYTEHVIELSAHLAKYKRYRNRNGRKQLDSNVHVGGGVVSMMQSIAPWMVPSVSRIGPTEQEFLFLHLAEKMNKRLLELNAGELEGGGVHTDVSGHPHYSCHIRRSRRDGFSFGKKNFHFCRWNAPTYRINRKFPKLLNADKVLMLDGNLAKYKARGVEIEQFVDIQLDRCVDETIERWIKEKGLWARYEKDCAAYVKLKGKDEARLRREALNRSRLVTETDLSIWQTMLETGRWEASKFAIRKAVGLLPPPLQSLGFRLIKSVRSKQKLQKLIAMPRLSEMAEMLTAQEITPLQKISMK